MTSRQLDEETIFHTARKIADADGRQEYLDQICAGDLTLRERVEALLATHEQESEFLKSNPQPAPTLDFQSSTESEGQEFGRYKLRERLGEGGFGIVWAAEQSRPVRRKVALKIIKPGMDSRDVVARFEAERQALALMDHPNIARVFDGGTTPEGRPYFVMELIRGVPITEYCDENRLTVVDRLRLFIDVCRAVQHAHQKGIIHRDIKPSNVLVTLHDNAPVPKVIDFGVAKAISQQLTDKTIYTRVHAAVGTLAYMAPEQAALTNQDIDTRADVYGLGVLLYELLTGTTPLDPKRLEQAAFDEAIRIIREEEPPKASTKLSSLGDTATAISAKRQTDPAGLHKLVRGELDWILLKALEKDRTRRYETASSLATDVQRLLDHEPVEACPPSMGYRVQKFVKRRRQLCVGISAVAVSLLAGIAGIVWFAIDANAQRDQVVKEKSQLEKRTKDYQDQVLQQTMLVAMSGSTQVKAQIIKAREVGVPCEQIELIEAQAAIFSGNPIEGIMLLEKILERDPNSVAANAMLAKAHYYSGDVMKGAYQREKAIQLLPTQTLDYLMLAHIGLGDKRALDNVNHFLTEQPSPLGLAVRSELLTWRAIQGDQNAIAEAIEDIRAARRLLGPTAYVLQTELWAYLKAIKIARERGDSDAGLLERARETERELAELFPNYPFGSFVRASFFEYIQDWDGAEGAWSSGPNWRSNPWCQQGMAFAMYRNGKIEDAREEVLRMESALYQTLAAPLLLDTREGRERVQVIYERAVEFAETDPAYRDPATLAIPLMLGNRLTAKTQAQKWLDDFDWKAADNSEFISMLKSCITLIAGKAVTPDPNNRADQDPGVSNVWMQYYAGLVELADGDLARARQHFEACIALRETYYPIVCAECILQQMNDPANPNWPSWISERNLPSSNVH